MNQTAILGLRTTIYKVNDLNKAKMWYTEAFGVSPYFDEPYYVGFNIGGYELGLQPEEIDASPKTANVISYWGVNHIQQSYENFLQLGATSQEAPFNVGGELMTATVIDPWGNIIGLIYNPDFTITA
ncbi:VOC family protein [Aquimarina hainanensis]|uniref:VOC family protein n=2 Tax=Aquimarina hainanensis TaxID=1578017 RepID=A0ABW5N618_9FLAO